MVKFEIFYNKLQEERKSSKINSFTLSKSKYDSLIDKFKLIKEKVRKDGNDYRFLKRYSVIEINGEKKLISPVINSGDLKYFVHDEELFNILHDAHISTRHGGRDRMLKYLKPKFANVIYKDILLYLSLCETCLQKQKNPKKGLVVKPMLFQELNSKCQIDLIDYQSQPDGEYKFVMVYQDHLTKFVILRPLKSNTASEVCDNVIDIFMLFGAPSVLQSDNGREFVNTIMENLTNIWPKFKIVYGKHSSQSQGSNERANQDIENMISTWMQVNQTAHWSQGLRFVQLMKNSAHHSGIKRSPYEALFGCPPKHGLASSSLTPEMLKNIESEEDLEKIINEIKMNVTEKMDTTSFEIQNVKQERDEYDLCKNENPKHDLREYIKAGFSTIVQQTKRLKRTSDQIMPAISRGTTDCTPIPEIDCERGDASSVLEVVLETTEDGF